jgi:hypothetical protein
LAVASDVGLWIDALKADEEFEVDIGQNVVHAIVISELRIENLQGHGLEHIVQPAISHRSPEGFLNHCRPKLS